MGKIRLLPEDVANKIAAGEVIERPASVVKELVENAIDARATEIEVHLREGGTELIAVIDNGIGMERDDALIAFKRHSTSKIRTATDLNSISTLGFRGEALPSIASVARVELFTRDKDAMFGTRVLVEDSVTKEVSDTGCPFGTQVKVSNLFYNIPARRKYLKTAKTEFIHVMDNITHFAVGHPKISFKVYHNDKESLFLIQSEDLLARIEGVLDKETANGLVELNYHVPELSITGFIGKPAVAKGVNRYQYIYLNNRVISSKIVSAALKKGFGTMLPQGRYPVAVIFINIDPGEVDVNVHPSKLEVRFKREDKIFKSVFHAVQNVFTEVEVPVHVDKRIPTYSISSPRSHKGAKPAERPEMPDLNLKRQEEQVPAYLPFKQDRDFAPQPFGQEEIEEEIEQEEVIQEQLVSFYQVHNMYIVVEIKGGVLLIDQHAAHERILYEQIYQQVLKKRGEGQRLLFPVTVELSPGQKEIFEEHQRELHSLGFEVSLLGKNRLIVSTIPLYIKDFGEGRILLDILDELREAPLDEEDKSHHFVSSAACHLAIRAGKALTQQEMSYLFDKLFSTKFPYTCPHGRPTLIKLTLDELAKRFGRK
ncbi:DNA mismatch repair endonuclease MutL [bacterium]|nr:DNA mismatch repair endonuclease MutL [bacterium]